MTDLKQKRPDDTLPTAKEWGPHYWYVMRSVAEGYGEHPSTKLKRETRAFYNALVKVLPCPHCRRHYKDILSRHPVEPHLVTGVALGRWVEMMRQEVTTIIARDNKDKPQPIRPRPARAKTGPKKAGPRKLNNRKPRAPPQRRRQMIGSAQDMSAPLSAPHIMPRRKRTVVARRPQTRSVRSRGRNERGPKTFTRYRGTRNTKNKGYDNFQRSKKMYSRPCSCSG